MIELALFVTLYISFYSMYVANWGSENSLCNLSFNLYLNKAM